MTIQKYLIPVSTAAAIHAALLFGFPKGATPVFSRLVEVPLPPAPKKVEDDPVRPPEEPQDSEEIVVPLSGGPVPPMQEDLSPVQKVTDFEMPVMPTSKVDPLVKLTAIPTTSRIGPLGTGPGGPNVLILSHDLDRTPTARVQMPPDYPPSLRNEGISGNVNVEFDVDNAGNVVRAKAVSSSNHGFDAAAVRAVLKWRFEPGRRHGQVVPFRMTVPIEFGIARD